MPTPITDHDRDRIMQLHAEGMARNAIARETGRSAGTVTKVVHAAGGTFERSPEVQAATDAKRVDNAAKRAESITRLYAASSRLFDRLESEQFTTTGYDRNGNAVTTLLERDATPPADIRHLSATAVNMLQAAARLEDVDRTTAGADEGRGIVGQFFAVLREQEPEG